MSSLLTREENIADLLDSYADEIIFAIPFSTNCLLKLKFDYAKISRIDHLYRKFGEIGIISYYMLIENIDLFSFYAVELTTEYKKNIQKVKRYIKKNKDLL